MNELVYLKKDDAFTDSMVIANKKYRKDLEDYGRMEFIDLKSTNPKGGRPTKIYQLNEEQGSTHADMLYMTYSKLANKNAGIDKRDNASVMQLNNLSLMEHIILNVIQNGITAGFHYKDIYKASKERLESMRDIAFLEVGAS